MKKTNPSVTRLFFSITLFALPLFLFSQSPLSSRQIDSLVERCLATFEVPGIAVAVIKDGKTVHAKGYGVRSLHSKQPVNEHTLFGVASNTKAFTAAALGMLTEEGKLHWDDKVIDYIPEFRMYNPYVTAEFTIRDLLTHRSGLGLGAGDLTIFPDGNDFQIPDVIRAMRYLKPVSAFRTKYDYDNLLYIIAGEVVTRVSGQPWEEFIEQRIMKPLGMNESVADFHRLKDTSNIVDAHAVVENKLQVIDRYDLSLTRAAGGIYTSIHDLSKWLVMLMNGGKYGTGKQLLSEKVIQEVWSPQTIVPVGKKDVFNTQFSAYGLGWFLSDVDGHKRATHTGGLPGMVTQVTMIPEIKLGIIVLTNQQNGWAFRSITNTILQAYFGMPRQDWTGEYKKQDDANQKNADAIVEKVRQEISSKISGGNEKIDMEKYTGVYKDNWFGEVTITKDNDRLMFKSNRSPKLTGEMLYYTGNTFVVRWFDRSMDADAFMVFSLDREGKGSAIHMKAISPLTDFSYDFHDLDLYRVK